MEKAHGTRQQELKPKSGEVSKKRDNVAKKRSNTLKPSR